MKYVAEAELLKLTYVDTYWKFIRIYEHQQETKVSFLAIFGTLVSYFRHFFVTLKRW